MEFDEEGNMISVEWRWYHAIGRLLRRDDGTPLSYVGMFVDINDKKNGI